MLFTAGIPNWIVEKETSNNYGIISKNECSIGSSLGADFQERESFYVCKVILLKAGQMGKMIKASCENSFLLHERK